MESVKRNESNGATGLDKDLIDLESDEHRFDRTRFTNICYLDASSSTKLRSQQCSRYRQKLESKKFTFSLRYVIILTIW